MFEMLGIFNMMNMFSSTIGIIGTTAAIVMGVTAAAAGGAAAYSARQQSKAAQSLAQQQRESAQEQLAWQREAATPGLQMERAQVAAWKNIFEPMMRKMGPELEAQLEEPLRMPEEFWQETWQRGRERIAGEFEPLVQKTTERLAGAGPGVLRGGQARQLFGQIERERVRSIEDLAIDQAMAEWQEGVAAKQQAQQNLFTFLGFQPSVPARTVPMVDIPGVPPRSSGLGEGIETGLRVASLFAGAGRPSTAGVPTGQTISYGGQQIATTSPPPSYGQWYRP